MSRTNRAEIALLAGSVIGMLSFAAYITMEVCVTLVARCSSSAIKSPFQALATKNLAGIKTQYTGIK